MRLPEDRCSPRTRRQMLEPVVTWALRRESPRKKPAEPLCRLVEVRQVPAEEGPRALLHLPHALAGQAPLLAQVLQRARIVLRQAVAQDVPRQLAHALAHLAQ